MNDTQAWSFLVSRNQYLDYRTIVAPDFMCKANISILLAKAAIAELSKPETAYYKEIEHPQIGNCSLIFRVIQATGDSTGLPENGVITDGFGREVCLIEGIVIKEFQPSLRLSQMTLDNIHAPLMEYYREFWEIFEPIPAKPSEAFTLNPIEQDDISLNFITLNRYIEQSDKNSSFAVRRSSILIQNWKLEKLLPCDSDVFSIVPFSDGKRIAVGCDQQVIVFDLLDNNRILHNFSGLEIAPGCNYPTPIALDPTEKFIVSAMVGIGNRNLIQLWNIEDPDAKHSKILGEYGSLLDYRFTFSKIFNKQEDTSIGVKSVALAPNGKIAISSSIQGIIKLWDTQGENLKRGEFSSHSSEIRCLAVDPNNSILASGDGDGYIKIWNLTTLSEREIKTLQITKEPINTLAFSQDGKLFLAGTQQGNIKLWNIQNWEQYPVNREQSKAVNSVAFHPNGYLVASGTDDNKIIIWDVKNKKSPQKITELIDHTGAVTAVVFTPNGKSLISGGKDRKVRIWQPVE